MTTITKERIEQYANDPRMFNVNDEIRQIARIALASLEAEPVAYIIQDRYERQNDDPGHLSRSHVTKFVSDDDIQEHEITCTPLYTSQPVPIVPEERPSLNNGIVGFDEGWNACRAAMLNGGKS
ncbi:TPA: valyl-tRNA synthetase [Salmonella enterica]